MRKNSRSSCLRSVRIWLAATAVVCLAHSAAAVSLYEQQDLVSDISGLAAHTDPNLVNPWGISRSATSPFWVSDNGTGVSTLYNGSGVATPLVVTIPPPAGGTPPAAPTGQVFNGTPDFELAPGFPARFIFATEDGTISGWNPGANPTAALLKVDNSASGAVYKGLAIGNNASGNFLYAADFTGGKIDVFDTNFMPVTLGGSFVDPILPAGFAPFNIQNLNGKLYVTYAKQDPANPEDDLPGPGNGFVDVFDTDGNFLQRLVSDGSLNSPWGLAIAPSDFGDLSNRLLIGNFGDGAINFFDPSTGNFLGEMLDDMGNPIQIPGLWGLMFGNGGNAGDLDALFFTAGIPGPTGQLEDHGLFGSLRLVPEPGTLILVGIGLAGAGLSRRRTARGQGSRLV